jgi:hypothetical protein
LEACLKDFTTMSGPSRDGSRSMVRSKPSPISRPA